MKHLRGQSSIGQGREESESSLWKPRVPRVPLGQTGQWPNGVRQVFEGELAGLIIKSAIEPGLLNALLPRLKTWETSFEEKVPFGRIYGKSLIGIGDDLAKYLDETPDYDADINRIFGQDYKTLVEGLFGPMLGGRKPVVPAFQNRSYKSCTVRVMEPDRSEMRAHVGNEFISGLPQCEHIAGLAELQDQLSYFFLLESPERGGELVLFDLLWHDTPQDLVKNKGFIHKYEERKAYMAQVRSQPLMMEAGDLLIFHGGRIWHQVNPVQGGRERTTIGGFMAFSQDNERVYYWS